MTKLKHDKYTMWLNWANRGWTPYIVVLTNPWPTANPRSFLREWAANSFLAYWDRKDWMILGGDKKPAGLKERK